MDDKLKFGCTNDDQIESKTVSKENESALNENKTDYDDNVTYPKEDKTDPDFSEYELDEFRINDKHYTVKPG